MDSYTKTIIKNDVTIGEACDTVNNNQDEKVQKNNKRKAVKQLMKSLIHEKKLINHNGKTIVLFFIGSKPYHLEPVDWLRAAEVAYKKVGKRFLLGRMNTWEKLTS